MSQVSFGALLLRTQIVGILIYIFACNSAALGYASLISVCITTAMTDVSQDILNIRDKIQNKLRIRISQINL